MKIQHDTGRGYERKAFFESVIKNIENALPPVISRTEAAKATGGLISVKTLSNEDALRKGPQNKIRVGSKVGYTREAFITYLRRKLKIQ